MTTQTTQRMNGKNRTCYVSNPTMLALLILGVTRRLWSIVKMLLNCTNLRIVDPALRFLFCRSIVFPCCEPRLHKDGNRHRLPPNLSRPARLPQTH
jgi:hypothetical protein